MSGTTGQEILFERASLNADKATFNANVNGSITPQNFEIRPRPGQIYYVERFIVLIRDGSVLSAEKYGGLLELTNGVSIRVVQGTGGSAIVTRDMTPEDIKSNAAWAGLCFDVSFMDQGAGDTYVVARFSFNKFTRSLTLDGDLNEALRFVIQDDLTGLVSHTFSCQGRQT